MQESEFKDKIIPLSSKLHRFACFFLENGDDARDVVQEVMLKLWQNRNTLAAVENHEAYAMRMTRNKCLDMLKSERNLKLKTMEGYGLLRNASEDHDRMEWKDTARLVTDLAERLPEIQKSVIFLRDMEQREYSEISTITGLNVNAVRVALSRARKQVRDELLKIWENENRRSKSITAKVF
jgi:RNA polymerase sigma-70 factor (ECF subfamily)